MLKTRRESLGIMASIVVVWRTIAAAMPSASLGTRDSTHHETVCIAGRVRFVSAGVVPGRGGRATGDRDAPDAACRRLSAEGPADTGGQSEGPCAGVQRAGRTDRVSH